MDLGLKGSTLAACLAELEGSIAEPGSIGMEFSALVILYSRYAGLRVPSGYRPMQEGAQEKDSLWVPTRGGLWEEVSTVYIALTASATWFNAVPFTYSIYPVV